MRIDTDYIVFAAHFDWYIFVPGTGYVPTDKAPDYAVEAMKRWNKEHSPKDIKVE